MSKSSVREAADTVKQIVKDTIDPPADDREIWSMESFRAGWRLIRGKES